MKRYNENERKHLIKRLKAEARDCLKLYGVKKTSVEELITRVNIPTGTFYLMFPSKEHLMYEVICDYKIEIAKKHLELLEQASPITSDILTELLFDSLKESMDSFLFQVVRNNEIEYITRKLPDELITHNEKQIKRISKQIFEAIPIDDALNFEELLTAFEILFYSAIKKSKIGEQLYYGSLWILLGSLVEKMMKKGPLDNS